VVKLWGNEGEWHSSSILGRERRSPSLYNCCGWTLSVVHRKSHWSWL